MRAVVIREGALEIVDRDDLTPGPGDVVVEVASAGLNAADLLQLRGFYPAPPGWPVDVPGMELAGTVVALGEGVHFVSEGDRVCAVVGGGAQATQCVVPAEHLIRVPERVDIVSAGGFGEAFTTAHDAVITQAGLHHGERLLVSGAAGGVGSAAIQIGAWRHAHVTACVRTMAHRDELLALGANEVITVDEVASLEPIDVVLELVGAAHLEHAQRVLAPHARVVVIGVGGGGRAEIDLLGIMARRATLTGSTLRSRSRQEKALVATRVIADLVGPWSAGLLRVPISATFALEDAADAYEKFAQSGKLGKIVLTI
jgi:NADPH:quinone reductase-like Zn-dependent oxidoreductase